MGEEEDDVSLTTKQLYLYINKLMTDSVIRKDTQILDEAIKKLYLLEMDGESYLNSYKN